MGEFEVHRVRFFELVPAGVRCMAYRHRGCRLALARTDGAVEVYNFAANYYMEKVGGECGENGEDQAGWWWWGVWVGRQEVGAGLGDGRETEGERGELGWGLRVTKGRTGRGDRWETGGEWWGW